jgi:hypothetical protein
MHWEQTDEQFLSFLRRLKDGIRSVTLSSRWGPSHEPLLRILEHFELDKLTI